MTTDRPANPVDFTVSYEGPSLDDHTMPVRDLAPALMALGEAFDRANAIVNGPRTEISLDIRATISGSFELMLVLHQALNPALNMMLFNGDFISNASALKDLIFGSAGLFGLLKGLRGRQPDTQLLADGVRFRASNFEVVVPIEVFRMWQDAPLRDQVNAILQPIARAGVERVLVKEGQEIIQKVEKDEVSYFIPPSPDTAEPAQFETVFPRQRLVLTSPSFDGTGKWRLHDGERNRWYRISDEVFNQEVQSRVRLFGTGDMLDCEVAVTQTLNQGGRPRMDYEIRRVLEHIPEIPRPTPRTLI